jgi:SAM-dependent methyltransferase
MPSRWWRPSGLGSGDKLAHDGRGGRDQPSAAQLLVRQIGRHTPAIEGYVAVTPRIAEFTDPRLVAIYDTVNAYDADAQPRFYRQLAAELGARSIVDLGCGTGLITRDLARLGYQVTGVDPAPGMLDVARHRPDGDRVHWIDGDADRLGTPGADLAVMTGHVAQFLLTDEDWDAALLALYAALRPGGHLAFESRNPAAREWEDWTRAARRSVSDPVVGRVDTWTDVQDVRDAIVSCTNHYAFASTGEELVSPIRLRFRTGEELARSLTDAGFVVEHTYGDWDRRPAGRTTRELIFVAAR